MQENELKNYCEDSNLIFLHHPEEWIDELFLPNFYHEGLPHLKSDSSTEHIRDSLSPSLKSQA